MLFPATIPAVLHTYTATGVDRLGMATLEYTSTDLLAYWLDTSSNEPPSPTTTDLYVERAELGVPADWPLVTPRDTITVSDRVWQVDGHPTDYSLGPFTGLWPEKPATVIHLKREVG